MKNYNPYDLIELVINGQNISGRPFEFDSEISTSDMKNEKGQYVKPTKISTTCPSCGSGLIFDVNFVDPPFPPLHFNCVECNAGPPVPVDPFINPLRSAKIKASDIDPSIHNIKEKIEIPETVVAERDIELIQILESPPEAFDESEDEELKLPAKLRKKPKKIPKEVKDEMPNFDDSELSDE